MPYLIASPDDLYPWPNALDWYRSGLAEALTRLGLPTTSVRIGADLYGWLETAVRVMPSLVRRRKAIFLMDLDPPPPAIWALRTVARKMVWLVGPEQSAFLEPRAHPPDRSSRPNRSAPIHLPPAIQPQEPGWLTRAGAKARLGLPEAQRFLVCGLGAGNDSWLPALVEAHRHLPGVGLLLVERSAPNPLARATSFSARPSSPILILKPEQLETAIVASEALISAGGPGTLRERLLASCAGRRTVGPIDPITNVIRTQSSEPKSPVILSSASTEGLLDALRYILSESSSVDEGTVRTLRERFAFDIPAERLIRCAEVGS
jgi:hypothetical protein